MCHKFTSRCLQCKDMLKKHVIIMLDHHTAEWQEGDAGRCSCEMYNVGDQLHTLTTLKPSDGLYGWAASKLERMGQTDQLRPGGFQDFPAWFAGRISWQ